MSKPQRIILVIYCFMLAYCFVWIPWRVTFVLETQSSVGDETTSPYQGEKETRTRFAYSFVWNPPSEGRNLRWIPAPAADLILLRVLAITAIAGAVFIFAGTFKTSSRK